MSFNYATIASTRAEYSTNVTTLTPVEYLKGKGHKLWFYKIHGMYRVYPALQVAKRKYLKTYFLNSEKLTAIPGLICNGPFNPKVMQSLQAVFFYGLHLYL